MISLRFAERISQCRGRMIRQTSVWTQTLVPVLATVSCASAIASVSLAAQNFHVVTPSDVQQVVRMSIDRLPVCELLDSLARTASIAPRSRWAVVREVATNRTPLWSLTSADSSFVVLPQTIGTISRCAGLSGPILISAATAQEHLDSGYAVVAVSVVPSFSTARYSRNVAVEISVAPNAVSYLAQLHFRKIHSRWRLLRFSENYDI